MRTISSHPIFLGLAALVVLAAGLGWIAASRTLKAPPHENNPITSDQPLQARSVQFEEFAEKSKNLEQSQQETIDQVQAAGDQIFILKKLLAAQQAETRRLTEQVKEVAEAVDGLRQSFATTRDPDVSTSLKRHSIRKSKLYRRKARSTRRR